MSSVRQRVGGGARLMDAIDPEWFEWVDIEALDMSDPDACISGQEFTGDRRMCWSGFAAMVSSLDKTIHGGDESARRLGFNASSVLAIHEMPQLRRAWIDEIRVREAIRDGEVEVIR